MKKVFTFICLLLSITMVFLFVGCGQESVQINFMVDGVLYDFVKTTGSEPVELPINPQKTGYTFEGWYWVRAFGKSLFCHTPWTA